VLSRASKFSSAIIALLLLNPPLRLKFPPVNSMSEPFKLMNRVPAIFLNSRTESTAATVSGLLIVKYFLHASENSFSVY